MGLFTGLDTQTDLSLVKGKLSTAQPAISRLHDAFFERIQSDDLATLMALDTFILPWLVHYYQTAQSECKQFKNNQLLAPFFKRLQFNFQLAAFERWIKKNLQIVQNRQEQVSQALQTIWSKKNLPTEQQSSEEICSLQAVSDRQWSDWSSRATGRNQGLYDAAVCVAIQSSEPLGMLELGEAEVTQTESLPVEPPSEEAEKKEKIGWGWRLFWRAFGWIKKELALISGAALIASLVLIGFFSPSFMLIAVCVTSLIGLTVSTLRPLWQSMVRWWRTDAEKAAQYYQFTEVFWSQSVDRFQDSTLDLKQPGLEFYRFELPYLLYQALSESGQKIAEAFSQRKPEHGWRANPIHQQYRDQETQRIQKKLQTLKTNFHIFHSALVKALYQQFKQAVVKRNSTSLLLHIDDQVLHTIHRLYIFLGMSDQVTVDRWLKDFFVEAMEDSLEGNQVSYLGLPLKNLKIGVKERLTLQYARLCEYWKIAKDAQMPLCLRAMVDDAEISDQNFSQDIPKEILEKFMIFCSHTFSGEYWKIAYLTEEFSQQLQEQLSKKLFVMGVSEPELATLGGTSDQMQAIHALMKKGIAGKNLVEYFNILNQAWQIYCVLSLRNTQSSSKQYYEKKQGLESLLENWLLSLDRGNYSIESNMIQVLLLARFDLSDSRQDTYRHSQREQVLHQIWWYLVKNWLAISCHPSKTTYSDHDAIEIALVKRYYQITKKLDVENCEVWLIEQLTHQETPQKKMSWLQKNEQLIHSLNIPRFTQFTMHCQQDAMRALQEVPHATKTSDTKKTSNTFLSRLFKFK